MIRKFALRYFLAKKSTHAINIISWVSIAAIAIGTAALIIVLSVFNGFEDLVKSLYSSFYPPIKVFPAIGKTILIPASRLKALEGLASVSGVSEVVEGKASIRYNNQQAIAIIKGVDSNYSRVSGVPGKLVAGIYATGDADNPDAVVGIGIASALGMAVRHNLFPITVYIPSRTAQSFINPEQAIHVGNMDPSGVFAIQEDFDDHYILTNIGFMRRMLELDTGMVSALEISLRPGIGMNQAKARIAALLGKGFRVETRYEQNSSLYSVMQTEKWVVYAFLSFILLVAAFNMIGSLSMLVIEKQKDITILKALGATQSLIGRIYLSEGLLVAGLGALIGVALALLVCLGQQRYGWVKLGGSTFVVDAYPVSLHGLDFFLVTATIFIIGLMASLFPSRRAARQIIDLKS